MSLLILLCISLQLARKNEAIRTPSLEKNIAVHAKILIHCSYWLGKPIVQTSIDSIDILMNWYGVLERITWMKDCVNRFLGTWQLCLSWYNSLYTYLYECYYMYYWLITLVLHIIGSVSTRKISQICIYITTYFLLNSNQSSRYGFWI